jgi:hypothetical protein
MLCLPFKNKIFAEPTYHMANTINVVNETDLGKMFKLELVMNILEPNSRRKNTCWRSRLDSSQSYLILAQLKECFDEFLERDSHDRATYELNAKIVGRHIEKNGK